MDTIGKRITFLREERNISQKELAITLHITAASLSRYENNIYKPKEDIIRKMAIALNTTADFLLGLSDIYEKPSSRTIYPVITAQEQKLLKYYRLLNLENRIRLDERAKTLYELESTKKNPAK